MCKHEFGRRGFAGRKSRIMGDARAWPEREPQSCLEFDKYHGAVLELPADDSLRGQSEPVPIKAQRALQVVDADGDDGNSRLQVRALLEPKL